MSLHPALVPLSEILHLNTRLFVNCLEGMTDEAAARRPAPAATPPVTVALHIVDARCFLATTAGAQFDHPLPVLRTVESVELLESPPPLEEIRAAWGAVSGVLARRIAGLGEEDLRMPATGRFPVQEKSLLGALAFLVQHESSHIGQLAYIRRLLGLPAMRYG